MVRLSLIFYGIQKVDYYFPRLENHHGRLSIYEVEQSPGVERRAADRRVVRIHRDLNAPSVPAVPLHGIR